MDRQEAGNDTAARQPRINRPDRSQVDPNPKNIDDLIPHDHPARLVWALVQELDMTSLYQEIKTVPPHKQRACATIDFFTASKRGNEITR